MSNKPISFVEFTKGMASGFVLMFLALIGTPLALVVAIGLFPYILALALIALALFIATSAVVYVTAVVFHLTKFAYGFLPESYRVLPEWLGLDKKGS